MKTEFVPYELAVKLKALGFNEPCFGYYHNLGSQQLLLSLRDLREDNNDSIEYYIAPTFSQAFRWFRDKKLSDAYVYRYQDRTDGSINFGYNIIHDYGIEETRFIKENYLTYEEAELACIEKLIEIVESKSE